MHRSMIWLLVFILVPAAAMAQEKPPRELPGGQGYAFTGFGAANAEDMILHFGGGGEAYLYRGLGIGAEIGYLGPAGYLGEGIGVFSANGLYNFSPERRRRVQPFVTGGYSLAFRDGTANCVNFGGGIHYWFSDKLGLRLEFRDHLNPSYADEHFWQGRVGIEFR